VEAVRASHEKNTDPGNFVDFVVALAGATEVGYSLCADDLMI